MELDKCYKIGWIQKPHGLKGEVTVSLDDDAPDDLSVIDSVFIENNQRLVPYFIQGVSTQGKKAFVKFEDVDTIDDASKIVKQSLYILKSLRPKSGRGEFYDDEIIGFDVHDEALGSLGKVKEIMHAGPNKLLVIASAEREVLIPTNGPFIQSINKRKNQIDVNLPEGFLDI